MGALVAHHVVIIGGGGTGAALVHDLAQRGFRVTLLERGELTSGTTGRHHGLLHSGARYVLTDAPTARICMNETKILRRIATDAIESNRGMFVALDEEDERYEPPFLVGCEKARIPVHRISREEALQMEPNLSPTVRRAVLTPDGSLDAWRLALRFFATAKHNGATIRTFSPVQSLKMIGRRVVGVHFRDLRRGIDEMVSCDMVANAAGVWSGSIAAMCGIDLPVTPLAGSMVAVKRRLTNMVINRLHPPGPGDIIVPQRRLSIIGATSWLSGDLETSVAPEQDITQLLKQAVEMVPKFGTTEFHSAWAAVRPLSGSSTDDLHSMSREFQYTDHLQRDGIEGIVSMTGGKATILRAMAERMADGICQKLKVNRLCRTKETPLLGHRDYYRRGQA